MKRYLQYDTITDEGLVIPYALFVADIEKAEKDKLLPVIMDKEKKEWFIKCLCAIWLALTNSFYNWDVTYRYICIPETDARFFLREMFEDAQLFLDIFASLGGRYKMKLDVMEINSEYVPAIYFRIVPPYSEDNLNVIKDDDERYADIFGVYMELRDIMEEGL